MPKKKQVAQTTAARPAASGSAPMMTAYYWSRGFLMLAPSFVLDRQRQPYRRLSITLMIALGEPFQLETGVDDIVIGRAALIAPKVSRRRVTAIDSNIVIADFGVTTPEFNALQPLLKDDGVCEVEISRLQPFTKQLRDALVGELPPELLPDLFAGIIAALGGTQPIPPELHPRIRKALDLIQDWPLPAATLERLAERVHLSTSRLRHLFADEMGSTLSHYLRWTAVWKAIRLWTRGQPLIEVATAVGFHDLAHLNRAFNEIFGLNPSVTFDRQKVLLRRCDWD